VKSWTWFLIMALATSPVPSAQQPEEETPFTIEKWLVGKTRTEVVGLLGEPSKTKVRRGTTKLIYKSDPNGIAFFPSTTPNPHAFLAEDDTDEGVLDTLFDLLTDADPSEYTPLDHSVTVGKKSAIRRIALYLDADGRVATVQLTWRRKSKRTNDADDR